MFPPFDESKAARVLSSVLSGLENNSIELVREAKLSDERDTSVVMLGAMVCSGGKADGSSVSPPSSSSIALSQKKGGDFCQTDGSIQKMAGNEVLLLTLSGISCRLKGNLPGIFVESIVSQNQILKALEKNDREIHELTDRIKKLEEDMSEGPASLGKKGQLPSGGEADSAAGGAPADAELKKLNAAEDIKSEIKALKKHRTVLCDESLRNVFNEYVFTCFDGRQIRMMDILKKLPPTGTGDCCAPKLLNYAFKNGLTPLSMAETKLNFTLINKKGKIHRCKNLPLIPPCDIRCQLILPHILGLDILYRDEYIIVVNKQSGLLSVPGRGPEKQDCIVNRVRRLFPECIEQPSVHRLDMETSGLLVLAFTKEAHRELNRQFENKEVSKKYSALIDGVLAKKGIAPHGTMELFFRVDLDNRPHQIWDKENGKNAVTEWKIENVEYYTSPGGKRRAVTRVTFIPHTGRTHQLRLAAADSHGFGCPIIGDSLYGKCAPGERLLLHATDLTFTHPVTQKKMSFHSESPF